jgi:hypothetical protein
MKTENALVPGAHQLHVRFNQRVGSNPRIVPNQNTRSTAANEQPQTVHISEFGEQPNKLLDIVRIGRGQIVVLLTEQFFTLVSNELAKIIRNLNELSIVVYNCYVVGLGTALTTRVFFRSGRFQTSGYPCEVFVPEPVLNIAWCRIRLPV